MTNTANLPLEELDVEYPPTVLRHELVDGSSGAGRFCGGMGLRRVYRAEAECHLRLDGSRLLTLPWGLGGGHPGGHGAFRFGDGFEPFVNGSGFYTPDRRSKSSLPERPAMAVVPSSILAIERDLADQCIDPATAAAMYPEIRR